MNKIIITPLGTVSPYCCGDMNCPGYLVEYNDKKILAVVPARGGSKGLPGKNIKNFTSSKYSSFI